MKILVDMNLSPDWCEVLRQHGWDAMHWSEVGSLTASDKDVMSHARQNDCVVFTHDLDFSAILAATQANAPSIIQVRAQDTLSPQFRNLLVDARYVSSRRGWSQERSWLSISIGPEPAYCRFLCVPDECDSGA